MILYQILSTNFLKKCLENSLENMYVAEAAQAPPFFLDQTAAERAEKFWEGDRPPLSKGLDDRPPPPPALYLKV